MMNRLPWPLLPSRSCCWF